MLYSMHLVPLNMLALVGFPAGTVSDDCGLRIGSINNNIYIKKILNTQILVVLKN
jgi:hypothetical protein